MDDRTGPNLAALCAALAGLAGCLLIVLFGIALLGASVDWWQ